MADRIKPEELRIGNWIETPEMGPSMLRLLVMHQGEYFVYHNNTDVASWHNSVGLEKCEPVPLSKDWLKNFGFQDDSYGTYYKKFNAHEYVTVSFKDYACTQIRENPIAFADFSVDIECKFVHQLQNLWHALTSTELQLKEKQTV